MKSPPYSLTSALLLTFLTSGAGAQTTLTDWDQSWNYFHPTAGALPAGAGTTTPHPEGTTPWFAMAAEFEATYSGPSFTTGGIGFEAGTGVGPLGYGEVSYTVETPTAEFFDLGTNLTTPTSGERFTAYFRTTFTIPDDGNFYLNPTIRYILDDGGFVYLDGELLLEVNLAQGALDDYEVRAAGAGNTESEIRTADLTLAPGTRTGGNTEVEPAIGGSATLARSLSRLSPGIHSLAVSVHNSSATSSDVTMAMQVNAEVVSCLITGSAGVSSRNLKGSPLDRSDDTINTQVTIASEGTVAPTWIVTGPAVSSLVGFTGAYNTPVTLPEIPVAEFTAGNLILEIADSTDATCTTTMEVLPQRIIGSNTITSTPILTTGTLDSPGWVFDEASSAFTLNDPGDPEKLYTITSSEIDLTGQPDVQFTGTLTIIDGSSGNEEFDQFIAFLILDGDSLNPITLIDRHDTLIRDGILTANELANGADTFIKSLNQIIPAEVNSARVVIQAVNDSGSEIFTLSDLGISPAPAELQAYARPVVYDNKGTADPGDDVFTTDVIITPANLGASTGWTSNETPVSGLYSDANPVTFGPFRSFRTPITVTLADRNDPTKTIRIPIALDDPTLTVSAPFNITRVENGPGFDDDSLTFEVDLAGTNGGPGWKINTMSVTPTSGDFGTVTFAVPAPLVQENLVVEVIDVSYRSVKQTFTVSIPGRYLVGQSDLSGGLMDISTSSTFAPSPNWQNDATNRTLTYGNNGNLLADVVSETIDLSAQDTVYFSAVMRASETSLTSNFETADRFRAELFYRVDDTVFIINLVSPYDTGDGSPSTTGLTAGVNGPADGFINGYSGTPGTDLQSDAVYTTNAGNYDANRERDEFNLNGLPASATTSRGFALNAEIPADAEEVFLVITGQGAAGNEEFVVHDILFSTTPGAGDRDADGIPTDYEISNGLNPDDASDRDTDLDGDRQSNYAEFLAGTAANDASSNLRIIAYLLDGSMVSTSWSSVPGKNYRVQFSVDLVVWTDLGVNFAAAAAPATRTNSGDFDLTGIGAPAEAYFRVTVAE
ncbi:MAG: hypothetical protein ACJAVK_000798 [Akkermansiaceae bacterium]|jgi:hypothetical protein